MNDVYLDWKFQLGFFVVLSVDTSLFVLYTVELFSEQIQSVINTCFIVGMTLSLLCLVALTITSWCRQKEPNKQVHTVAEKPVEETDFWACKVLEAGLWDARDPSCPSSPKSPTRSPKHASKIWPDGCSEKLGTNGQRTDGQPSTPETGKSMSLGDAACDEIIVEDLEGASDFSSLVRIAEANGDACLSPRSENSAGSDASLCCACCLEHRCRNDQQCVAA